MENARNQDTTGKQELLVVSFGTTYEETRRQTIGAIEDALAAAFPGYEVRRAFTSRMIVKKLRERDGIAVDSPEEALERAVRCGVKTLIIQPTHLMDGNEYHKLEAIAEPYRNSFETLRIGAPLLTSEADFETLAKACASHFADRDPGTAVALMGHGTDAASNAVYSRMQEVIRKNDGEDFFIATVEGEPVIEDILPEMQEKQVRKVILAPLMIVAGDHANNDLAGDEEDSWKSILERAGMDTEARLQGIGAWTEVQELFAEHVRAVL